MALGLLRLQYTRHKKIAAAIRAGASRDLFYAKERRLAEMSRILQPMFWATKITWEPRVEEFRVYYDVVPPANVVVIRIVQKGRQTTEGSLT